MNVLCIDQFSDLGGGQRSLLDLIPSFKQQGWSVSVAAPGHGVFKALLDEGNYRVHDINCASYSIVRKPTHEILRYAREVPQVAAALTRIVNADRVDVIYVNGPRVLPPAALVSWKTGIPLAFHSHNRLFQRSAIALTGRALQLAAAHVIACCRHTAEPLAGYLEPERLSVVFNGVPDLTSDGPKTRPGIRTIGVIGRIEREKGQLEFVRSVRRVLECYPNCRFEIVGTPMFSDAEYHKRVVAESDGFPIDFVGWQDDIANVYSQLDMLVVPSSAAEATTRVILEAYSAGVCVVSFPSGGIPEVLQDGRTGFLTADRTPESLARRMIEVLSMTEGEIAPVIRAAREEWKTRFSLKSYREQVCHLLSQVAASKAADPHKQWPYRRRQRQWPQ